jgi:2-succinyl-6-hydroxy-2,4-cyclohexadiene-1-carboxylate synthase
MEHARETTNVAFVPGFMQPAEAWTPVAERVAERGWPVTYGSGVGDVVVGYSHGGRLAIQEAAREPRRFAGLVLVGATPGIEDDAERAARRSQDEELAAWIESHTIEEVVARWESQPIFATQSPAVVAAQRPGRLSHDPRQLAEQLRTTGQGVLEPVWHALPTLAIPVLAIAGELDVKYAEIARRMGGVLPNGTARIVPGAGHAPQVERPAAVAELLLEFLDEHFGEGVIADGDAEAGTLGDG